MGKQLPFCAPSNTEKCIMIGKDTFGKVYKTQVKEDCSVPELLQFRNKQIAIKVFKKKDKDCYDSEKRMYEKFKELQISGIVPYYCGIQFGNTNYLCMKLCTTSLDKLLEGGNLNLSDEKQLTIDDFHLIYETIYKTINEMLTFNIAHRDIKPDNILYEKASNQYYLCDIGAMKKQPKCFHQKEYEIKNRYVHPGNYYQSNVGEIDRYCLGVTLVSVLENLLCNLPDENHRKLSKDWFEILWSAHSVNSLNLFKFIEKLSQGLELDFLSDEYVECSKICAKLLNIIPESNDGKQLLCKLCKTLKLTSEFSIIRKNLPNGKVIHICTECSEVIKN